VISLDLFSSYHLNHFISMSLGTVDAVGADTDIGSDTGADSVGAGDDDADTGADGNDADSNDALDAFGFCNNNGTDDSNLVSLNF
jgi:hypothetical protein